MGKKKRTASQESSDSVTTDQVTPDRAIATGWCASVGLIGLLIWLVGGIVLESFHGLKSALYLEDELRREMWILAHAHGTLLSAISLLLVLLMPHLGAGPARARRADRLFAVGAVLVPIGFLLGGAIHSESDPSLWILLVPAGAIACGIALALLIFAWLRS